MVSFPGTLVNADRCTVADHAANIDIAVNPMGIEHLGFAMDHVTGASLREILTAPEWPRAAAKDVDVTFRPWSDGYPGSENHTGYPNLTRAAALSPEWRAFYDSFQPFWDVPDANDLDG